MAYAEQLPGFETSPSALVGITSRSKEPISLQERRRSIPKEPSDRNQWSGNFLRFMDYGSTRWSDKLKHHVQTFSHFQITMLAEMLQAGGTLEVKPWMVRRINQVELPANTDYIEVYEPEDVWYQRFPHHLSYMPGVTLKEVQTLTSEQLIRLKDVLVLFCTNEVTPMRLHLAQMKGAIIST